jgi:hypothetical protein
VIILLVITGCSSVRYEKNNITDRIGGNPSTLIFNYENRAKQYDKAITHSHLKIYIEIEEPFIISIPEFKPADKIYSIAAIEGTAVYRLKISSNGGTVISTEKKLSAGLGLDEAADEILSQLKIEPAWMAGESFNSTADVRISFITDGEQ